MRWQRKETTNQKRMVGWIEIVIPFIAISFTKLIIVSTAIAVTSFVGSALYLMMEKKSVSPIVAGDFTVLNASQIAARLIDSEVEAGVDTDAVGAKQVLAGVLRDAESIRPSQPLTTSSITQYFREIGRLLGKHFYYQRSTTLTEGLNRQVLDCDLRAFLYQTIAKQAGVDVSIIYSPSHAFIGWRSTDNQMSVYWETTSEEGNGVDLTSSLYSPSEDPGDYRLLSETESEDIYRSWIIGEAFDQTHDLAHLAEIGRIAALYPERQYPHLIQLYAFWRGYGSGDPRFTEALEAYVARFGEDDSSRYLAFRRFSDLGDRERALAYFRKVDLNDRAPNDFAVAARVTTSWAQKSGLYFVAGTYWALVEMKSMIGAVVEGEEYVLTLTPMLAFTLIWIVLAPVTFRIPRRKRPSAVSVPDTGNLHQT